jgi:hypothetical protein
MDEPDGQRLVGFVSTVEEDLNWSIELLGEFGPRDDVDVLNLARAAVPRPRGSGTVWSGPRCGSPWKSCVLTKRDACPG